jgi:hypothetical protein
MVLARQMDNSMDMMSASGIGGADMQKSNSRKGLK